MFNLSNTSLAFVLPERHPYHFAIVTDNLDPYDKAIPHRDGTDFVNIKDANGNNVEMLTFAREDTPA